jgi:ribosomal protein S21
MGVRVVVSEGESIKQALARLRREMQDACVFDELMIHADFDSHGTKRRLKQRLAKQRSQDLVIWERLQRKFHRQAQQRAAELGCA